MSFTVLYVFWFSLLSSSLLILFIRNAERMHEFFALPISAPVSQELLLQVPLIFRISEVEDENCSLKSRLEETSSQLHVAQVGGTKSADFPSPRAAPAGVPSPPAAPFGAPKSSGCICALFQASWQKEATEKEEARDQQRRAQESFALERSKMQETVRTLEVELRKRERHPSTDSSEFAQLAPVLFVRAADTAPISRRQ